MSIKRKTIELDLINKNLDLIIPGEALEIKNNAQVIEFSSRIIQCLKAKVKEHNATRSEKTSLSNLKRLFCEASEASPFPEYKIQFSIAKVNLLLRLMSGSIDLTKDARPSEEDFALAAEDVIKYDLNYHFNKIQDLYLDGKTNKFWYDV